MQFPDLFKVLADYVGFVADFLLFKGMGAYALQPTVNSTIASYFVAGVLVAYLFATATRLPGYERHLQHAAELRSNGRKHEAAEPLKEASADIARFMVFSVFAVVVTHGLLVAGNCALGGDELRGVKATMNAVLGWGAVYHPLNAFTKKCAQMLRDAQRRGVVKPRATGLLLRLLAVMPHIVLIQLVHALATVHGRGFWYMAALQGIGLVILCVLALVLAAVLVEDDDSEEATSTE